MTAIAEFDPEPDTRLLRNLLALLLVSAVLHGTSLGFLRWSPASALPHSAPPKELSVELLTTELQAEENPIDVDQKLNQSIEPSAERTPHPKRQNVIDSSASSAQLRSNNDIVYDIPRHELQMRTCNAQQKRTAGHVCAQQNEFTDHRYTSVYEHSLAALFHEERTTAKERAADLRAVDALLAQQVAIDDALSNFENPPAHLLSEKNRINNELARIDEKYSSIDVLKILSSSYKTARKLATSRSKD